MTSRFLLAGCLAAAVFGLLVPPPARAAETKLAIMPLTAKRVPTTTVEILDDLLVNEVGQKSGATVIGAQDINAILGLDKMKDALGCNDLSCAVQIGGALGVDFLLTGSVSTLGGEVIVSLTLIDTQKSVAYKRAQVRIADQERLYAYAIAAAVAQLYDLPAPAEPVAAPSPGSPAADRELLAAAARDKRRAAGHLRDADPPPAGPGGIRFKTDLPSVRVTVRSMADGKEHACTEPVKASQPCYLQDLPAGPATVTFQLADRRLTREIVVRAGDLERQMVINDGSQGATPWVVGAVFAAGGAALLYWGLSMDKTPNSTTGEPEWGTSKTMATIFGGSTLASGVFTPLIIVLGAEDYPIWDSATPRPQTVAAPAPASAFGLTVVPTSRGASAMAVWRF